MSKFKITGGAFEPHSKEGEKTEIILPPEQAGSIEYDSKAIQIGMTIVAVPTLPAIAKMVERARKEGKTEIMSPATRGRDEDR